MPIANDGMAHNPPPSREEIGELRWRIVSGCVLAISTFLILWGPSVLFTLFSLSVFVRSTYELFSLPNARKGKTSLLCGIFFLIICGGLACLVSLRGREGGFHLLIWLISVVSVGDIGAYAVGSLIGGPKIFPQTSPKKTWSGSLGGVTLATLIGSLWNPISDRVNISVLAMGIALSGILGDYFESFVKRHLGIKDFGSFIPGHGGVLDRLDSLYAAALFLWSILYRM
jgi:phosphatidate cytidylyltransferase